MDQVWSHPTEWTELGLQHAGLMKILNHHHLNTECHYILYNGCHTLLVFSAELH